MAYSYRQRYYNAWKKLGIDDRYRPDEVFPRHTKESWEKLRKKYYDEFGYYIRIPKIDEIIHLIPTQLKTKGQIKAEKREGLMRILASPSPDWIRSYSSVMTWMDNIQDMTSVVYPAVSMLARWSPKLFGKLLGPIGWLSLGTDLLNLAIAFGRMPFSPMGGKRAWCNYTRDNPFTKKAQFLRKERIRKYKPGIADLIQTLQVTDQFTGVGLNLGPMMGSIMDMATGLYRYISGDKVQYGFDVPDLFEFERAAGRGLTATGLLNSAGQIFSEETHFWSLTMGAAAARLFTPVAHDYDIVSTVEDPMNVMIPAHEPTDPLTLEVIREEGLSVQEGVLWPYNKKKEIRLGDLWDELIPRNREVFRDYCMRHSNDWYGYVVASTWSQVLPSMIFAFDPTGQVEYEDTEEQKVAFRMLKGSLLPTIIPYEAAGREFIDWIPQYTRINGNTPGLMAIKEKFDALGIKYRETYPIEREPTADEFFPKDFPISDFNMM